MKIKKNVLLLTLISLTCLLMSSVFPSNPQNNQIPAILDIKLDQDVKEISKDVPTFSMQDILTLTPKKYKEITGKKMSIKQAITLKVAQKKIKKFLSKPQPNDISKGGYIVLAIIGLGWLAIGLKTDFNGDDWWIALLLGFLCWLPGVIYTLVKMKKFYS